MVAASISSSSTQSTLEAASKKNLKSNTITYQSTILPRLSNEKNTLEVNYDNITSLYVSIEDCDWKSTKEKCKIFPADVRTWVVSGNANSSLSWCTWRRLPIHEACRRQPPLDVIQELLQIFPESAMQQTQFGELPIHLAAGYGASFEVILLLLAYNPWAVSMYDHGGQTPLELVKSTHGKGMSCDYNEIVHCLQRSDMMINAGNLKINSLLGQLRTQHVQEVQEIQKKYKKELKQSQNNITLLQASQEKSKGLIKELVSSVNSCESRIKEKNVQEQTLMNRIATLEQDLSNLRLYISELKTSKAKVEQERLEKSKKIIELHDIMQQMSHAVDISCEQQFGFDEEMLELEKQMELLRQKKNSIRKKAVTKRDNMKEVVLKALVEGNDIVKLEEPEQYHQSQNSISGLITPSSSKPPSLVVENTSEKVENEEDHQQQQFFNQLNIDTAVPLDTMSTFSEDGEEERKSPKYIVFSNHGKSPPLSPMRLVTRS